MHVLAEVATEVGGEEHPAEDPPNRSRHREECISRPARCLFTKMRATGHAERVARELEALALSPEGHP